MGSLWKELAARWLGGGVTTPEQPSMARTRKKVSSSPAPRGVTNGCEDQPPEEALQPDAAVRYPC